jgi:predicted  nucleic acid-binding Zn-ribbon protein
MNDKKEIEDIYKKYFLKGDKIPINFILIGSISDKDRKFLKEFVNVKEVLNYDAPDGYLKLSDYDVVCEHFAIDISKTTKKGSLLKKESKGDSQSFKLNEYVSDIQTEKDLKKKISDLAHVDNFKNNLKTIYEKHYKNRETYIENVHSSG